MVNVRHIKTLEMNNLLRLIDANLNRSQEGLRVCEDIVRFMLNDKKLLRSFKSQRQKIGELAKKIYQSYRIPLQAGYPKEKLKGKWKLALLKSRNVKKDIGKKTTRRESRRKDIGDVFRANIQRVKESLRVLEEAAKLLDKKVSQNFKKIRFRTYVLEKESQVKLETLLHNR